MLQFKYHILDCLSIFISIRSYWSKSKSKSDKHKINKFSFCVTKILRMDVL